MGRWIPITGFCIGLFILSVICVSTNVEAVTVAGSLDTYAPRAGDTLTVVVVGKRITSDRMFLGAAVRIPEDWARGAQSVISPRTIGDTTMKEWRFQFVPSVPGSTRIVPLVIVGEEVALNASVDSVAGPAIWVSVVPARVHPVWPWFLAGAVIVVAAVGFWARAAHRRREADYERSSDPPLTEALKMLETIRANRREDRGRQYLDDIERVIHGYVSRRLGVRLSGKTATEIGAAVAPRCSDSDTVTALTALLKRCDETKFGGSHINFDMLTGIEGHARSVLERLDANWV